MEPGEAIRRGAELLSPALTPFGFVFRFRESVPERLPGSPYVIGVAGPAYAIGEFRRQDRFVRLEFSWSLGPVTYHVGDAFVDHEAYLRALGVAVGVNRYPGVADESLQAFRDLAYDLAAYCSEFLAGDAVVFLEAAEAAAVRRADTHRRNMAGYVGDETKRAQAKECFKTGDYERVIALLESVQYPDLLDPSEKTRLEIARRRSAD